VNYLSYINIDLVGCDPTDGKASAIIWQYGHDRPVGSYYGCTAKTSRYVYKTALSSLLI
jgi:hypothetical protein